MSTSAWDTQHRKVLWITDGVQGLPTGLAAGRYECRACGESLILRGARAGSKVAPHFAHRSGEGCSKPEREAQIDADDEVVIRLRETIRALPGVTDCTITSPGEAADHPSGFPPALLARCGAETVIIEAPTAAPDVEAVRRRIRAVREHHGGAMHVWFLRQDPAQFGQLRPRFVRLHGETQQHEQVAPTAQQLTIIEAGGHVYWLDGKKVLVPYGVHEFLHPVKPEQDWQNWEGRQWKRADPRADWRISKPLPAPTADSWGLVPISLSSLTRTRAAFRPADAYAVMDDLYATQQGRFRWRNQHAGDTYAQRHTPPARPATEPPPPRSVEEPRPEPPVDEPPVHPSPSALELPAATEQTAPGSAQQFPPPPSYQPGVLPQSAPEKNPGLLERLLRRSRRRQ
ncbi:competence protein CoiA family protein [Streptomyces sp. NPDC059743]|uniref:competence protein CoiA family protein n=1 Tax=Streptomyces sp. NPDC059743 TaxID=3346928 RepID=UPI00365B3BE1